MGYNIRKKANDERLQCVGKKRILSKGQENMEHEQREVCSFFASVMGEIASEMNELGSRFKNQNDTLYIKTHDFVDELKEGDIITIRNFNKDYLIVNKFVDLDIRNSRYMKYDKMNKTTRFYLRGKD